MTKRRVYSASPIITAAVTRVITAAIITAIEEQIGLKAQRKDELLDHARQLIDYGFDDVAARDIACKIADKLQKPGLFDNTPIQEYGVYATISDLIKLTLKLFKNPSTKRDRPGEDHGRS